MKTGKILLAATAIVAAPVAVQAQDVGAQVMGNDDAAIGTVVSNDGTTVVLDTGKHQVPLGTDAFAETDGTYSINISKTQLDQMMDQQLAEAAAALEAALVVGAPVVTADAQSLGMVDEISDAGIIIKGEDDTLVTLPVDMLALNEGGAIMALANMADIQAALESQGG